MNAAILVLTIATMAIQLATNTSEFVHSLKAVHHHTTRVVYRKVLKPVGKAITK